MDKCARSSQVPFEKAQLLLCQLHSNIYTLTPKETENLVSFVRSDPDSGLVDLSGWPPLHIACRQQCHELIGACIDMGADLNTPHNGRLPLHLFIEARKKSDVARQLPIPFEPLVAAGADINVRDGRGRTPLLYALYAEHGMYDKTAVPRLLELGADPNIGNHDLSTPLMAAISDLHLDNASSLLAHGARVNDQNSDGDTALHHARLPVSAELLLKHGARTDVRNKQGETALMVALDREEPIHLETMAVLLVAGSTIAGINWQDETNVGKFMRVWRRVENKLSNDFKARSLAQLLGEEPSMAPWAAEQLCAIQTKEII